MNREQSIDHCLRATWQAVAKMYNEQAAKHNSTMAMA
ncbi:MAG: MarR family transcriptional regulator, partial [Flavobacteriales bacterium CG03_land_8_20_14_0_80_35_15]